MKKYRYIVLGVLWLLFIGYAVYKQHKKLEAPQMQVLQTQAMNTACFGTACFSIEIAETPQERELWLMNRKYLPERSGMLFVFEQEAGYRFWMKNTLIPLDMIWISSGMIVVDVKHAVPCISTGNDCPTYDPKWPAKFVLEIPVGRASVLWITEGVQVSIVW